MKAIVFDFQSETDYKIISVMAKRLGAKIKLVSDTGLGKLKEKSLTDEEKEDIGMVNLIKEADLSDRVSYSEFMKMIGR